MRHDTRHLFDPVAPMPLSPVEELVCRVDERVNGSGRVAAVMRLQGCVEERWLTPALLRLQQRHPKLRASIVRTGDTRRRFEFSLAMAPIPFEIKDGDQRESPWREEVGRRLEAGFPDTGPLVGVVVLRDRSLERSTLILVAHHAVADGLSTIAIVDDLLAEYESVERPGAPSAPPAMRPAVALPHTAPKGGWLNRLRLFAGFVRLWREEKGAQWTDLPSTPGIPAYSQWEHWVFSEEDTLALVRRCRREKVSLNNALFAAAGCGLRDCLNEPARFKCKLPIDMRQTFRDAGRPIAANDLGCFVSFMQAFYRVDRDASFWDLARRAHRDLQTFVERGGHAFNYNLAVAFRKLNPVAKAKRGTLFSTSYGVLNIRDRYGSLRPEACTLVFKNDVVGPSLIVEALVLNQQLNLGIAAFDLEPAFWARLQTAIRAHLTSAIDSGTGTARPSRTPSAAAE